MGWRIWWADGTDCLDVRGANDLHLRSTDVLRRRNARNHGRRACPADKCFHDCNAFVLTIKRIHDRNPFVLTIKRVHDRNPFVWRLLGSLGDGWAFQVPRDAPDPNCHADHGSADRYRGEADSSCCAAIGSPRRDHDEEEEEVLEEEEEEGLLPLSVGLHSLKSPLARQWPQRSYGTKQGAKK